MQNSKLTRKAPTKVVRNKGNDNTEIKVTNDTKPVVKISTKIVKKSENKYVTISTNNNYEKEEYDNDYYESSPYETINFSNKRIIKLSNAKDSDSEYELTPEETLNFPNKRIFKVNIKMNDDSDDSDDNGENSKNKKDSSKTNNDKKYYDRSSIDMIDYNRMLFDDKSYFSKDSFIKSAWESLKKYKLPNSENLKIIKSRPGHFVTMGQYTGSLKNPHWLVYDNELKEEYYIMYCFSNIYTKFSKNDYKEIINPETDYYPTWHFHKGTGYCATKSYPKYKNTEIYLHQIICQKHNEKKFVRQSVDHINRDKLDNRYTNLRFTTQSVQNQNTDKRNRKHNAQNLPEGVSQKDMPKYVGYKPEKYGKNKEHLRECFVIEKHPLQKLKVNLLKTLPEGQQLEKDEFPIRWATSKSRDVTNADKLKAVQQKRKDYDEEFQLKYPTEFTEWIKNGGKKY
jgi:hypothetical protein